MVGAESAQALDSNRAVFYYRARAASSTRR
jgi:hypothetical protein